MKVPGWYDLYDTDEAMNIVAAQQRDIAKWIAEHWQELYRVLKGEGRLELWLRDREASLAAPFYWN